MGGGGGGGGGGWRKNDFFMLICTIFEVKQNQNINPSFLNTFQVSQLFPRSPRLCIFAIFSRSKFILSICEV